jgi:hypothetical protein
MLCGAGDAVNALRMDQYGTDNGPVEESSVNPRQQKLILGSRRDLDGFHPVGAPGNINGIDSVYVGQALLPVPSCCSESHRTGKSACPTCQCFTIY